MRYKVKGHPGVAFFVSGYPKHFEPYNSDDNDGKWIEDKDGDRVFVTMVGDDHKFEVDKSDLIPLDDSEYCRDCGQTGCTSNTISED